MSDEIALYTIPEAAAALRCSRRTVYRIIGRGELEVVTVGARWRVPDRSLLAYLARNGAAGGSR